MLCGGTVKLPQWEVICALNYILSSNTVNNHKVNQFPLLILKPGKEKSFIHKHPWLFSGAVKEAPQANDGDIIAVADNRRQILGFGFYAPNSQIVCRLFHFGSHSANFLSETYWMQKFNNASALRRQFISLDTTNSYRLIHAEGDFMPGIIVDVYKNVAVMQLLVEGTVRLQTLLVKCLQNLNISCVYLKNKTNSNQLENMEQRSGWLTEAGQNPLEITEHNLRFLVDVETGQKTGFFIDQRENRLLLQQLSMGKKVLNAFCYTGGFSIYALAGGATEVISVDISKPAIAMCEQTAALNFENTDHHHALAADCFEYLRRQGEAFDIIVVDPPAFAKNARAISNAARGYKDLNMLAIKKTSPGGLVMTFSCSHHISKDLFQKIIFAAAADAGRNVRIIRHLSQPEDHPINIFHPESEYLKGLLLWVE